MHIVDAQTARALDADAIDARGLPGMVLMERAALGVVDAIRARYSGPRTALALVGSGNNGGDGSAVARLLTCDGWSVTILQIGHLDRMTPDARKQLEIAAKFGVEVRQWTPSDALETLSKHAVWIDALAGIGAQPPLREPIAGVLDVVHRARRQRTDQPPFVVAVDVPSGACASTGRIDRRTLTAQLTVTFGATRWAHWLPPAVGYCGDVAVVDIGLAPDALANADTARLLDARDVADRLPPPAVDTHKGRQGRVTIVSGCNQMPGAAVLSSKAALVSGAGLVTLCSTASARSALMLHAPEAMTLPPDELPTNTDAWLVGPGLGLDLAAQSRFDAVLEAREAQPMVIDADALTLLAAAPRRFDSPTVLTPHPAELARLLTRTTQDVIADLVGASREAAVRYRAIVIAKTAGAVIVGDGDDAFVAPGSPGMATAGSGDVLAGLVAGLAARMPAGNAARVGAWLHAAAGRAAADDRGPEALRASDIISHVGHAFLSLRDG